MAGLGILVFFTWLHCWPRCCSPGDHQRHPGHRRTPGTPSAEYWLGTDDSGRSMLALLAWGARVSLTVGIAATLISMVIGTSVGIASGHYRGSGSATLQRLTDWVLVIPFLPLAIVLATVLGGGSTLTIIVVIGVTSWAAPRGSSGTDPVRRRPTIPGAVTRAGQRQLAPDDPPRPAQRLPTGPDEHHSHGGDRHPLGDDPVVPGARRPLRPSWGSRWIKRSPTVAVSAGAWWYIGPPGLCVVLWWCSRSR